MTRWERLLALEADGWALQPYRHNDPPLPYRSGQPKIWYFRGGVTLRGQDNYMRALLEFGDLAANGLQAIEHGQPPMYYKRILAGLPDVRDEGLPAIADLQDDLAPVVPLIAMDGSEREIDAARADAVSACDADPTDEPGDQSDTDSDATPRPDPEQSADALDGHGDLPSDQSHGLDMSDPPQPLASPLPPPPPLDGPLHMLRG
eukprot:5446765-Alexandrium_andersonii.AAC.1